MTPDDLRAWRKRLGLSQVQAATALGLSVSRIIDYERGTTRGRENAAPIPRVVELACAAIEIQTRPAIT